MGDTPAGSLAQAVLEADQDSGTAEAVGQSGSDDTDDSRVPVGRGEDKGALLGRVHRWLISSRISFNTDRSMAWLCGYRRQVSVPTPGPPCSHPS